MISFYPFLFRFGISFDFNISNEIIENLLTFFQLKYNIELKLDDASDNYSCISISDKVAKDYSPVLSPRFLEKLDEYNVQDFQKSLLFIDIKKTYSDKFIDGFLLPELHRIIQNNNLSPRGFPFFILCLDEVEKGSLVYDKIFYSQVKHNLLDYFLVFDKKGNFIDKDLEIRNDRNLAKLVKSTSTSVLDKFQFKMIRKIDHFQIKNDTTPHAWIGCQQFFYDGVKCSDEAYQLLEECLIEDGLNPHYIVHDTLLSNWLGTAVTSLANSYSSEAQASKFPNLQMKKGRFHGNCIDISKPIEEPIIDESEVKVLFISSLISSGKRFKKVIRLINQKFPKATIQSISALVTSGAFKKYKDGGEEGDLKIKILDHQIKFFKKVDQVFYDKGASEDVTMCPMCKHKLLPLVESNSPIHPHLRSYEMWLMSEEAGYKIEDYPRPSRSDHRIIPDALNILKRNGALLSIKFEQQIRKAGIYPRNEIVIVYPEETAHADHDSDSIQTIEKTASGYFAKCLNLYNPNFTYLGVPRKMIKAFEDNPDMDLIKARFPKTTKRIEEISRPIVIIDEANFSGQTFKSLAVLLQQLDGQVAGYFPMFDYDSENTALKYKDARFENVEFLSFYQLEFGHD